MMVTSCQKRVMIARSQLTVVMWVPCPWSHPTGKECNIVTKRIPIVLSHFVNWIVLHITWGIEMINHIYPCQIIAANSVVLRVWISVPPCFPSHRAWVDSSGRLFHDRETTQATSVSRIIRKTSWDVERSCHVYNNDGDINPISYLTEKKIYSFLTMCKQWHVSCKQPTHDFFFRVVISSI